MAFSMHRFSSSTRGATVRRKNSCRNGSTYSRPRSRVGWLRSRLRRPPSTQRPMWDRSRWPARLATVTSASPAPGATIIRAWSPGSTHLQNACRPSRRPCRRLDNAWARSRRCRRRRRSTILAPSLAAQFALRALVEARHADDDALVSAAADWLAVVTHVDTEADGATLDARDLRARRDAQTNRRRGEVADIGMNAEGLMACRPQVLGRR